MKKIFCSGFYIYVRIPAINAIEYRLQGGAQNNNNVPIAYSLYGQNDYTPITKGHLAFLGHAYAYYELDAAQRCSTSNFKIKQLENIPCACCGNVMATNKELDAFVCKASRASGDELKKLLEENLRYLRPIEEEAVKILCDTIESKPDWKLPKLVKYQRGKHIGRLHNMQNAILNKMEYEARLFDNESDHRRMGNFINHTRIEIKSSTEENLFKRKVFLQELKEFGQTFEDKKTFEEIYKIAQVLPGSTDSLSAFFVKYSKRDSKEIAYRLLIPGVSTAEHIKPQSDEGENKISNYVAECAYCNSRRGNMPLDEWVEQNPQMPQSVDKYLREVYKRYENGELDGKYKKYFVQVAKTLKAQSKGLINPDVRYAVDSYNDYLREVRLYEKV